MDLPWQLRPNRFPVLVDGSTRLQFGQSGFLPSIPGPLKLGPRPPPSGPRQSVIPSEPCANPLTHPLTRYRYSRTRVRGDQQNQQVIQNLIQN